MRAKCRPRLATAFLKSSGRGQRLISDVMDVSRLQNGLPLALRHERISLKERVEEIIDESRAGYPDVRINFYCASAGMALGDADRLFQTMGNLISNARHHGDAGYVITVYISETETAAERRVVNRGKEI